MNFLYADSATLFAHGHRRIQTSGKIKPPGLYFLSRRCVNANEPVQGQGMCVGPGFQQVLLIAGVPLTESDWQPVVEGEVLAIFAGQVIAKSSP